MQISKAWKPENDKRCFRRCRVCKSQKDIYIYFHPQQFQETVDKALFQCVPVQKRRPTESSQIHFLAYPHTFEHKRLETQTRTEYCTKNRKETIEK